jgi:hypothetical protein
MILDVTRELSRRARYVSSLFLHRARSFRCPGVADGVPAASASFSLFAKSLVDEIALASVAAWATLPTTAELRERAHEVRAALELFAARGWLDDPASYHGKPPALGDGVAIRRTHLLGAPFEHLHFESGHEPPAGLPGRERWLGQVANRTAHAWMLRHAGVDAPWIVCLHPFQTGTAFLTVQTFRARWLHQRLGLNVVMPVLPLHGPRRSGRRSGDGLLGVRPIETLHGMSQALWDVRRILSWIRTQSSRPIGLYGLSLGGYTTALVAGFEADLAFAIAGVPAVDFVSLERWHSPPFARRRFDRAGADWEGARRVLSVVSPLSFSPRISRERRFLFAGLGDQLSPVGLVHGLWKHWEEPRTVWFEGGHISCRWETAVRDLLLEAFAMPGFARAEGRPESAIGKSRR